MSTATVASWRLAHMLLDQAHMRDEGASGLTHVDSHPQVEQAVEDHNALLVLEGGGVFDSHNDESGGGHFLVMPIVELFDPPVGTVLHGKLPYSDKVRHSSAHVETQGGNFGRVQSPEITRYFVDLGPSSLVCKPVCVPLLTSPMSASPCHRCDRR